jgi:hypothetical protein
VIPLPCDERNGRWLRARLVDRARHAVHDAGRCSFREQGSAGCMTARTGGPSSPIPVSTTPSAPAPTAAAPLVNSSSTDGVNDRITGPSRARAPRLASTQVHHRGPGGRVRPQLEPVGARPPRAQTGDRAAARAPVYPQDVQHDRDRCGHVAGSLPSTRQRRTPVGADRDQLDATRGALHRMRAVEGFAR